MMPILPFLAISLFGVGEPIDYDKLFRAVSIVESGGNPQAYNRKEDAAGIVQIRMVCLRDCNRIVGRERWASKDRFNLRHSRTMFGVYLRHWLRRRGLSSYQAAARIWNGGPKGYQKKSTWPYWQRVQSQLVKETKQ